MSRKQHQPTPTSLKSDPAFQQYIISKIVEFTLEQLTQQLLQQTPQLRSMLGQVDPTLDSISTRAHQSGGKSRQGALVLKIQSTALINDLYLWQDVRRCLAYLEDGSLIDVTLYLKYHVYDGMPSCSP